MSEQGSPERRPLDAAEVESSPGTDQRETPKERRKKKGEKRPVLEMKLTVDVQQWLRKENTKVKKMKLIDLKIYKAKQRGQIRSIN